MLKIRQHVFLLEHLTHRRFHLTTSQSFMGQEFESSQESPTAEAVSVYLHWWGGFWHRLDGRIPMK